MLLRVVVSCFAAAALAACSTSADSSTPTASGEVTQSPVPALTPTASTPATSPAPALPALYSLSEGRIDIGDLPDPLRAQAGTVSVAQADGGGQLVSVRGLRKENQLVWVLELTVTNQGRAQEGTFVSAGRTWNVTPGTGEIRLDRAGTALVLLTLSAITLTESTTPTANTPMVVNVSGVAAPTP